jgi:hypothetical protein
MAIKPSSTQRIWNGGCEGVAMTAKPILASRLRRSQSTHPAEEHHRCFRSLLYLDDKIEIHLNKDEPVRLVLGQHMSNMVAFFLGLLSAYLLSGFLVAAILISRALSQTRGPELPPNYRAADESFAHLYGHLFRTKDRRQVAIWHVSGDQQSGYGFVGFIGWDLRVCQAGDLGIEDHARIFACVRDENHGPLRRDLPTTGREVAEHANWEPQAAHKHRER